MIGQGGSETGTIVPVTSGSRGPTREGMGHVIEVLRSHGRRLERKGYPPRVDFSEGDATRLAIDQEDGTAGPWMTVACLAGHYAAALAMEGGGAEQEGTDGFEQGMEAIARAVGLEDSAGLCRWARDSPEVWGNRFGAHMFGSAGVLAFGGRIPQERVDELKLKDAWDPRYFNDMHEAD